jgi:hypothetical protein
VSEQLTAGVVLRWCRAAVLAATMLGFAATAHSAADGRLPGPVTLAVLSAVTTSLLAGLLGRPASTARVVVLLVGGQAALHAVFTALSGHGSAGHVHPAGAEAVRVAVPGGTLAKALGADQIASGVSTSPSPVQTWVHHLVDDLSTTANLRMALAHLLAAGLLGMWLASGERLVWRLVVLLSGPAAAVMSHVAAMLSGGFDAVAARAAYLVPAPPRPPAGDPPRPTLVLLARAVDRRGPPVLSV